MREQRQQNLRKGSKKIQAMHLLSESRMTCGFTSLCEIPMVLRALDSTASRIARFRVSIFALRARPSSLSPIVSEARKCPPAISRKPPINH